MVVMGASCYCIEKRKDFAMSFLLNKSLPRVIRDYNAFSQLRLQLQKYSDAVRQGSKRAIFYLLKHKLREAHDTIAETKKNLQQALLLIKKNHFLADSGVYQAACEEYLEAKLFENYLLEKTILDLFEFSLPTEIVLGAISDFTGELVRKSILLATDSKKSDIEKIKKIVEEVVLAMTNIELSSGGYLRNKIDQVDKNLRKIEEILYSLSK